MQAATAKFIKSLVFLGVMLIPGLGPSTASPENQTLPLSSFSGRPVVEVTINGEGPYPFILDTGARSLVIDQTLAEDLGLEAAGMARTGAPGNLETMEVPLYTINSLALGGLEFSGETITGMDLSLLGTGSSVPRGIFPFWSLGDGLIRLSLGDNEVSIDRSGFLTAGENEAVPLIVGPPNPFPEFAISLGGTTFMAHLDTGSPGAITLPLEWQDRLTFSDPPRVVGKARLMGEEREVWMATLAGAVKIGGIELENPTVMLLERIPGANIGSGFLKEALVEVDLGNNLIRITPEDRD